MTVTRSFEPAWVRKVAQVGGQASTWVGDSWGSKYQVGNGTIALVASNVAQSGSTGAHGPQRDDLQPRWSPADIQGHCGGVDDRCTTFRAKVDVGHGFGRKAFGKDGDGYEKA